MKSFSSLILALSASLFLSGPSMAEQDNASSSIFDLQITDSDITVNQTSGAYEGDDLNTNSSSVIVMKGNSNLSSVIVRQGNSTSNTSIQAHRSDGNSKSNLKIELNSPDTDSIQVFRSSTDKSNIELKSGDNNSIQVFRSGAGRSRIEMKSDDNNSIKINPGRIQLKSGSGPKILIKKGH